MTVDARAVGPAGTLGAGLVAVAGAGKVPGGLGAVAAGGGGRYCADGGLNGWTAPFRNNSAC